MTGLQRTRDFICGKKTDRVPVHPIIMRWASKYGGVKYRDFCLDYRQKCQAMLRCADDFELDWVTVMSDAWAEASAFGVQVDYPEDDLPVDTGGHLPDLRSAAELRPYRTLDHGRLRNRLEEIREFKRLSGDRLFIVGWVEGPVAEYVDLRGAMGACEDFMDDPGRVGQAMDIITESALGFITCQIQAGAHCVGIGDAFCSQIGPELFRLLGFERERRLVEHIHALGALAKLHICGNTSAILPDMIRTGADIIDVDHLVASVEEFAPLLGPQQVFSGKCDPVSVVQNGTPRDIAADIRECQRQSGGRCIISAGCEITPDTSLENFRALQDRDTVA